MLLAIIFMMYWRISHNPYFSRWFSAMFNGYNRILTGITVTILILVDGFLQYIDSRGYSHPNESQSLF